MSYEEEDTCESKALVVQYRSRAVNEEDTCVSYEEEDTCESKALVVQYRSRACKVLLVNYGKVTCVSYEEEDTMVKYYWLTF